MQTVADGYFTTQRLRYFNDTATNLSMEVSKLDPARLEVAPIIIDLDSLESDMKSAYRRYYRRYSATPHHRVIFFLIVLQVNTNSIFFRSEFAKDRGNKSAVESEKVRVQALDVEELIRQAADESGNSVLEVANLANSLDRGSGPHLESAVSEAIELLKNIQERTLDPFIEKAEYEFGNVCYFYVPY